LEQIYTKHYHYWRFFWAISPHLLSHNGKIWREVADLGLPVHPKFGKMNALSGYARLGKIYTKNSNFLRLELLQSTLHTYDV